MDIAELKTAITGLEDGLQVVVRIEDDEVPLQIVEWRYESCATPLRGFVLMTEDGDWSSLRGRIVDLEEQLDEAVLEIESLRKQAGATS